MLSAREKEANVEGGKVSHTLGGVGEGGTHGGGSGEEVRGLLVAGVSVSRCVYSDRGAIIVKVDTQGFC